MNLYLDTSGLVKRYLVEEGSLEVNQWISQARPAITGLITRAELAAAISRASRMGWISPEQCQTVLQTFRAEWESFGRLPINEATVRRADELACRYGLRGFDAVHLACAMIYQEGLGVSVTLLTYDRELWEAGRGEGLKALPESLPG